MPWLTALRFAEPATPGSTPLPDVTDTEPTGPALLLARLQECRYQARRLAFTVTAHQAHIHELRCRLAAGPHLQAALGPADPAALTHTADALRRRWLGRWLEEAADELLSAVPAATLLAARRSSWHHEAAWLEAFLAQETEQLGAPKA